MLTYLIKTLMHKYIPKENHYAEDIIKGGKESIAATLCLTQDEIYNSMYHEAKDLFHDSIKAGQLNREQILYIKYSLREFLKDYREYYNAKYKNDAHEIYSLLKSPFLSNEHYTTIITMMNKFIH
ncbi:hypothetical protein [Clostridium thermarum]|uniref:hypothetical protein n=1 Tax=Clostridium thermarum TaxID=1716543 RepID=UPI00111CACA4|nr:hypothetical protein [Clostridium thermarum]